MDSGDGLLRLYNRKILNDIQYITAYDFRIKILEILVQKFHFVSCLSDKTSRTRTNQIFQLFLQLSLCIIPKFFRKYFRIALVRLVLDFDFGRATYGARYSYKYRVGTSNLEGSTDSNFSSFTEISKAQVIENVSQTIRY